MPITQAIPTLANRAATASFALSATAPGTAATIGLLALLLRPVLADARACDVGTAERRRNSTVRDLGRVEALVNGRHLRHAETSMDVTRSWESSIPSVVRPSRAPRGA